uniref:DUF7487 domain-containing protein n=1 Tax=viral metagenome TaxID=1070528 RepID=A0A6C0CE77_9ZZZZ
MTFICDICNKDFPSLYKLNRHKNGKKSCKDKLIINYNSNLLQEICDRDKCKIDYDKIDKYNNNIRIHFICECGKHYQKIFTMMYKVGAICDNCTNMLKEIKKKTTCLDRYGVENPLQSQEVKDKKKQTCLDKYGVEHPLQSQEVKDKSKQTCLDKYGVEYSLQAQEVKDKSKEYFIKTYGVENASQVQENKDKKKKKAVEIYGVENISQSNIIKNKKVEKSFNKYGTEHVLQSQEIKDKSKQTCLDKYGVEYPMQNAEFSEKVSKNAYKSKEYNFLCGNTIQVQGYEPFLLKNLVLEGYTYEDITVKKTEVPEIWYEKNNKQHRYYCDVYIPKINTIYEVKSTWTYKKDIEDIPLKRQACIDKGYLFELFVFDSKGIKHSV